MGEETFWRMKEERIESESGKWIVSQQITDRYVELFERVTGKAFVKNESPEILDRIEQNIVRWFRDLQ